jgi:DNA processing protein
MSFSPTLLSRSGVDLTEEQRLSWLRLIRSENVGPRTFRTLLNHFGGAAKALEALPTLATRGGAKSSPRLCSAREAQHEMQRLAALGARLIALGEADYPQPLAAIEGAPPLITVLGNISSLHQPCVAIVGARNASAAGRNFATRLARDLGEAGFTIVSGLARGMDTAAHQGALATGTVAAIAGGLDKLYPAENIPLAHELQQRGALITEMPLGWEARARDFPRRNRLIAGLALGIIVVEAAPRSGSLITSRLGLEMGREVMAVPGSPMDSRCEGSNGLLRQGATFITSAQHVIEALQSGLVSPKIGLTESQSSLFEDSLPYEQSYEDAPEDERQRIIDSLSTTPTPMDDLIRLSCASARAVQLIALEFELAGRLERLPGGRLALRSDDLA